MFSQKILKTFAKKLLISFNISSKSLEILLNVFSTNDSLVIIKEIDTYLLIYFSPKKFLISITELFSVVTQLIGK